ncbi:MAG TPA: MauE/DoxX family redox-associated membrane protein [Ferruginibacter sp.]|jgi:uncharacterized membrane protein YphA (DoxX/SURF4 family)|nr:MauE/DoxX family redox-associated membrane protein [Ferruginibacter sp.]
MKSRSVIIEVICGLFILLFMYAAVSKLLDIEKFRVQVGQSPLLTRMAGFVAWFIPAVEILISIMLTMGRTRLVGLFASFGLMVMFTAYIVAITQFSDHVPCSCGGILQKLGWTEHLVFNIGFVALGAFAVILHSGTRRADSLATG